MLPAFTAQLVISGTEVVVAVGAHLVEVVPAARAQPVVAVGVLLAVVATGRPCPVVVAAGAEVALGTFRELVRTVFAVAEAGVVSAAGAAAFLVEGVDVSHVVAAFLADAVGVALGAPVVVAVHAVHALGASLVVAHRAIGAVGVAFALFTAVVAAPVTVRGDVVAREVAAVLGVDGSLEIGHGGEATTGVVNLFPGAVCELLLEGESGDDESILDFLLEQLVGTEDVTGRVLPAQLVGVGALPLHCRVNLRVDEACGGRGENAVALGDGAVHGSLLCRVRGGHEVSW